MKVPPHGRIGGILVLVFWFLNWSLTGLRTHWAFFPLWVGYSLTVDGVVAARKGESMFLRNRPAYLTLYLISIPAWWVFEVFNVQTTNWQYLGQEYFTNLWFAIYASLSFSTVIPAVFSSAELMASFRWIDRPSNGTRIEPTRQLIVGLFAAGIVMTALIRLWPDYYFPLVWGAMYCLVEPINFWLGHGTLFDRLKSGDWREVAALCLGALMCGFFWEMWNYYSYPKWIYRVPFVGGLKVFEMPLAGYLGYIPFALELSAMYRLIAGILKLQTVKLL